MTKISVSILGSDNKIECLKKLNKTDADYIHLDIMDGKLVPFKTPSFSEISKVMSNTNKKLDVHLMVENPSKYINDYALLNTEFITIHVEIKDVKKHLNNIKEYGLKCGLAINPETDINTIIPYLEDINLILIMSVKPGLPGQTFMPEVLDKITPLKEYIKDRKIILAIDGGINETNAIDCNNLGIDMICSGTYITSSDDYQYQIKKLRG